LSSIAIESRLRTRTRPGFPLRIPTTYFRFMITAQTDLEPLFQRLANDAASIVRATVGGAVRQVQRIARGVMTHKFAVQLEQGPSYVVRFYPPQREFVVEYEPDIVARCNEAGVPVPTIVVDSRRGPPASLPYMAYRLIEGNTLAERLEQLSADRLREVCARLVECFAIMRSVHFEGYGDLRDGTHGHRPSWSAFVETSFREGLVPAVEHRLFDPACLASLTRLESGLESFAKDTASEFNWGDVRAQNILLDQDDRLACLLDFEGGLAGDPLVTLGYGYAVFDDHRLFQGIARIWPDAIDWRQLYFYAVLRVLRVAKYASSPLPTGESRSALTSVFPGFHSALRNL